MTFSECHLNYLLKSRLNIIYSLLKTNGANLFVFSFFIRDKRKTVEKKRYGREK